MRFRPWDPRPMTLRPIPTLLLGSILFLVSWGEASAGGGPELGSSVHSAGDINGDGLTDVIVGAPGYGSGGVRSVYLYYGRTDRNLSPQLLVQKSGSGYDSFGACVTACGDVEAPEPCRLRHGELKARHLDEFPPDAFDKSC